MNIERLQAQLKQRDFKLTALLELTKAINNNLSTQDLLAQYESIVKEQLRIPRLVLISQIDHKWQCMLQYGLHREWEHLHTEADFAGIEDITIVQKEG